MPRSRISTLLIAGRLAGAIAFALALPTSIALADHAGDASANSELQIVSAEMTRAAQALLAQELAREGGTARRRGHAR